MPETEYTWTVANVTENTPTVKTLHLTCEHRPDFTAGQYLTVKLPEIPAVVEGKSYSISSAPYEDELTLTIKKIGAFSDILMNKQTGDTLTTDAPYGFFFPDEEDEALVFIAAGIGITPFLSIIKQLVHDGDTRPITLITSNRTVAEAVFSGQFTDTPNVRVVSYITRETTPDTPHITGRMTPQSILEHVAEPARATCFLCGSMHFTKDMWQGLKEAGFSPEQLYTEGFF